MKVILDEQVLFDRQDIEIELGSPSRDFAETSVPGLNGLLSVDLGKRKRKIRQLGVLRASSRSKLSEKINAISAFLDGRTHTLIVEDECFEDVRLDSFKLSNERAGGIGLAVDYEIVYTQLRF